MIVRRTTPRSDDLETGMDVGRVVGHADAYMHPWEWDDKTAQELADELEERLAKKRPLGFAPWPEEATKE